MEEILNEIKIKYNHLIEPLFEKCSDTDILIHFDDLVGLEAGADFLYVKFFIVNSIEHLGTGKCIKATISLKNLPLFIFLLDQLNLIEHKRILFGEGPKDRKPLLGLIPANIPDHEKISILLNMDFVADFRPSEYVDDAVDILLSVKNPLSAENQKVDFKTKPSTWGF